MKASQQAWMLTLYGSVLLSACGGGGSGGAHAVGDKLDPRVAFSEGFGYAFAAMVLGDPLVRDAYGSTETHSAVGHPR